VNVLLLRPPLQFRRGWDVNAHAEVVVNPRGGFIEDLDTLPPPAYHLLDPDAYLRTAGKDAAGRWRWAHRPILEILTSRGCPFRCTFCTVHALMGRQYRWQSAAGR